MKSDSLFRNIINDFFSFFQSIRKYKSYIRHWKTKNTRNVLICLQSLCWVEKYISVIYSNFKNEKHFVTVRIVCRQLKEEVSAEDLCCFRSRPLDLLIGSNCVRRNRIKILGEGDGLKAHHGYDSTPLWLDIIYRNASRFVFTAEGLPSPFDM